MVKSLIGLSAVLSFSLLATVATAAGPRPAPLAKADHVGRPAPAALAHVRHSHATMGSTTVERRSAPARLQRQQIRTEIVVGSTSHAHAPTMSAAGREAAQNMVRARVLQRVRCADSTACGSGSSRAASTRMISPNKQRDGVSEMRHQLRNERLYRMIMARMIAKTHPGK